MTQAPRGWTPPPSENGPDGTWPPQYGPPPSHRLTDAQVAASRQPSGPPLGFRDLIGRWFGQHVAVVVVLAALAVPFASIESGRPVMEVLSVAVPVFAVLLSMLLFGVSPLAEQVIGGAVVLAGVLYMQWQRVRG